MARRVWLAFPLVMLVTVGSLVSFEQKPAPPKISPPCSGDLSLDAVRALNNLHSRINHLDILIGEMNKQLGTDLAKFQISTYDKFERVEKRLDAVQVKLGPDPEIEALLREVASVKQLGYQGEIKGKSIVLTPKK